MGKRRDHVAGKVRGLQPPERGRAVWPFDYHDVFGAEAVDQRYRLRGRDDLDLRCRCRYQLADDANRRRMQSEFGLIEDKHVRQVFRRL